MKKYYLIPTLALFICIPLRWLFHLEFIESRLNYLFELGWLASFPLLLIVLLIINWPKKRWIKIPLYTLLVLLSLFTIFAFSIQLSFAKKVFSTGNDPSSRKLHEIQVGNNIYTCYRYGKDTTDCSIVIRREYRFWGLTHYKFLSDVDQAYDAMFYQEGMQWYVKILGGNIKESDSVIKIE